MSQQPGGLQMAAKQTPEGPSVMCKIELPTQGGSDEQFGGTRTVHSAYRFSVDKQIGEGTYGQVFMGHDKHDDSKVALKKIRMDTEKEGFPITAIREIKLLSSLQHINVVNLREIVRSEIHKNNNYRGSIYMVFDYADYDLTGLMESQKYVFTEPQVKCILKQILRGLHFCHQNGVLHRDLKASNILIDSKGVVKLADFGLARAYRQEGQDGRFTNRVITLWYRPPELLLGADRYGPEVDVWSVGCIFAELLTGKPLFPGKDETDQLDKIFQVLGTPTPESAPGLYKHQKCAEELARKAKYKATGLREALRQRSDRGPGGGMAPRPISEDAFALLEKMLSLDPERRIDATAACMDTYLTLSDPPPCDPADLPCRGSSHEYTMKKRRHEAPQPTVYPIPQQGAYGAPDPKRARPGYNQGPYNAPGPRGPGGNAPQAPYYGHNAHTGGPAAAYAGARPGAGTMPPGPGGYNQPRTDPGRGAMPPPGNAPRHAYPGGGGMAPPPANMMGQPQYGQGGMQQQYRPPAPMQGSYAGSRPPPPGGWQSQQQQRRN